MVKSNRFWASTVLLRWSPWPEDGLVGLGQTPRKQLGFPIPKVPAQRPTEPKIPCCSCILTCPPSDSFTRVDNHRSFAALLEIVAQTDWTETLQASLCFRRVKETSPYPTPPKQESKDFPERIFILSNRVFRIWACNKKRILGVPSPCFSATSYYCLRNFPERRFGDEWLCILVWLFRFLILDLANCFCISKAPCVVIRLM